MSHKLLKGRDVAQPIREDIRRRVDILGEKGWVPSLASIEVGDNPAAKLYIRNQRKTAEKLNILFEERKFASNISTDELVAAITAMNVDPRITGIILQRPLPTHIDLGRIQTAITASKDVEGMHPANIGKVVYDDYLLGPCTSLASVECLKATGMGIRGLEVVVVGHSEIVGKPLGLHLMGELATVTICHHGTRNLATHTRRADAVFVAVGKPGLITGDMIKPGAAVIDVGINQVEVENADGVMVSKTVGDVDFDSVHEVAGWITPVPGGVGPVTLSILMRNTVAAVEAQKQAYEERMMAGD